MATNEDPSSPFHITFTPTSPNTLPNVHSIPSAEEAEHRYDCLPSRPYFIARSSHDIWVEPTWADEDMQRRELRRVGEHPICDIWEGTIAIAMHNYLVEQEVQYTSLDPVRMGIVEESDAPVIIWVGVEPGSLSAKRGVETAVGLRALLLVNGIEDVHVEIRESVITTLAKLYQPADLYSPTAQVQEPFSTTLGMPICSEKTPEIQGTATLHFTDPRKPGKLYCLSTKHALFRVDEENDHYEYHESGPRRNVLLLGTNGFEARVKDIEKEIRSTQEVIEVFKEQIQLADKIADLDRAQVQRENAQIRLAMEEEAINKLEEFLIDIKADWTDPKKRIIGHVVLSPPLILSAGKDGLTQDFAVIKVDPTKIDATNFVGNAIDLGNEIPAKTLIGWMHPNVANQTSFRYPPDRLLKFHGILSNAEMAKPNPKNVDKRGDPTIMVLKRGSTTGLTVGCLNNIRSVLRKAFKTKPDVYSKEVTVLPRSSESGPFSKSGDSGAAVVNGFGAVVGVLTSGSRGGLSEASDCTYVTPIAFLLERLEELGYSANIFPTAADIIV